MGQVIEISKFETRDKALTGPRTNPVDSFLGRLGNGSRRGLRVALNTIAKVLSNEAEDADTFDWPSVRYEHSARVREVLVERFSANTVNFTLSALRGVLKECWRLGLTAHADYARATDLKQIRGDDHVAGRVLTLEELVALFRTCQADESPAGIRDAAILAVLYGTGLRRAELAALKFEDYDQKSGTVTVHGKGSRIRLAYVVGEAKTILEQWLKVRGTSEGPLFVAINKGGELRKTHLTGGGLWQLLRRRAEEAKVANFSPHDLRRTTATHLLERGVDIAVI